MVVAVAGKLLSMYQLNSGIADLSVLNAIFHQPNNKMICEKGKQILFCSSRCGAYFSRNLPSEQPVIQAAVQEHFLVL